MNWTIEPGHRLVGEVMVPGDKSISHRALLLAAIADGTSSIEGLSSGQDVAATLAAIRELGVEATAADGGDGSGGADAMIVRGAGLRGLHEPAGLIDCGNSGTTVRLLAGLAAGQPFTSVLTGDRSLRSRPMRRIAEPLRAMGANVETSGDGTAPLRVVGASPLRAIVHRPEVASAQVKSCVLLAGLYADGRVTVEEPAATRDHTERMLSAMGAEISHKQAGSNFLVAVEPGPRLASIEGGVPGDLSSAAYWLVAASLLEGSEVVLPGVGVNPTRRAIVDLLVDWGAAIEIADEPDSLGEPVATLTVTGAPEPLTGGSIEPEMVPGLIDELPLLAALAPYTREGVEVRGAAELRVKESDRIATTAAALRALGVEVEEFPDGLAVAGGQSPTGGTLDAAGDHRIALAFGVAAVAAAGQVTVAGAAAMEVSYPGFAAQLDAALQR